MEKLFSFCHFSLFFSLSIEEMSAFTSRDFLAKISLSSSPPEHLLSFPFCNLRLFQRPISFFFPLRQTPFDSRHFFPPHQLFKKGKKLREKKKETRQIFSFFLNLEIEAFARL